MADEKNIPELAAEAARTIKMNLDVTGEAGAPKPADPPPRATREAKPTKSRPDALKAVFARAHAKLGEAYVAMYPVIASDRFALCDARPNLADAKSPRDRWPIKGGRMLDGIVYLTIPMGKLDWRVAFGRECVNYGTISRNTSKRQAIMPSYGDTVIAFIHTTNAEQTHLLVEIDPIELADVDAWVDARVADMMSTITRHRSP